MGAAQKRGLNMGMVEDLGVRGHRSDMLLPGHRSLALQRSHDCALITISSVCKHVGERALESSDLRLHLTSVLHSM